ncbi:MAG: succinyldiaminopimelate transaminase [Pseudomonadota bacterium]|nr:succinyldiaminopimelate transaminase [Pseudomonadota bacterium]
MNPLLSRLLPYPFERWRELTRDVVPNPALRPISLSIGEPRHPAPALVESALVRALPMLSSYPATVGEPALREAIAAWLSQRHHIHVDPTGQVLPVNGSREALFALAQTVIDPTRSGAVVVCPNPFYQIYEGAALLAGATPVYVPSLPDRNFAADWEAVDEATWARTQLLYVCSPGNPTGAVMGLDEWRRLFDLSDRHGFVIVSDECYSEIHFDDDAPPLGSLQAAALSDRSDFRNLIAIGSLSKRSSVPGLRSGFAAGDRAVMQAFSLYRTYHGSAMSGLVQRASIAAWNDETHVRENRMLYRQKFDAMLPLLQPLLDVRRPDAGFYLWAGLTRPGYGTADAAAPTDEIAWARDLLAQYNVAVLPGSLLARDGLQATDPAAPRNPGRGRVRLALVAPRVDCIEAAERIAAFVGGLRPQPGAPLIPEAVLQESTP